MYALITHSTISASSSSVLAHSSPTHDFDIAVGSSWKSNNDVDEVTQEDLDSSKDSNSEKAYTDWFFSEDRDQARYFRKESGKKSERAAAGIRNVEEEVQLADNLLS